MSNLAKTCRDVKDVIREHRVYGAESVIRSIVNVNEDPYLTREEMIKIGCKEGRKVTDRQLKKYEYMHSVAEYQEAIHEAGEDIEYDAPDEVVDHKIELLRAEKEPIAEELKQIKSILRKNKLLAEYIADFKLTVQSPNGDEIPVTQETLVGFIDNNEFLTARREMLAAELDEINRRILGVRRDEK